MSLRRKIVSAAASGTLGPATATGTTVAGTTVPTYRVARGTLSCLFTLTAGTTGVTMTPKWQVSKDASTWYTLRSPDDTAPGVMATGVQAATSRVITAPAEALGWEYVRPAIVTGGDTGVTADTYSLTSYYVNTDDFSIQSW